MRALAPLLALVVAATALGSESWPATAPPAPLAGFSFSPLTSAYATRDPALDLARLLESTNPDVVRLPIYWDQVQPTPMRLDFTSVDALLDVVARHNATSERQTRVVLTVGARNFLYPELHQPEWAGARSQPSIGLAQSGHAYRRYFEHSVLRYRASPLLYAWQVENEPLDSVTNEITGDDRISPQQLAWEVAEVHRLDPAHKVVTTTYNAVNTTVDQLQLWAPPLVKSMGSVGSPEATMGFGDVLGLDVYVDGPSVPMRAVTSVDLRAKWKQQAVGFWADRAHAMGKELWLTEMQAQPWDGSGSFAPNSLVQSAVNYRQEPVQVVLMWGVETWLGDPAWMAAGAQAMDVLQAT